VIPNLLSGDIFKPRDKKMVRAALGMDSGKQVIGFGAAYQNDPVKGSHYLLAAIEKLDAENGYSCLVFGETEASFAEGIKIPLFESGKINNHDILAALYNACDVFVCPSMIENLPNVCLEALFCGIPVAAFRTGGIPDIVEHKKTGYLAEPYDTGDLYRGILYCLDNYEELSRSSVKKAAGDFNSRDTVNKHIKLYEEALKS
ncbi:MAG: glycosyltransferase, partial [Spirochaetales bacterium]|nr:glycosyltransferase [Spirochaetales bacterium]